MIFFAKKLTSWKVVLLVIFVIGIGVGIYFLYCYIEKCGIFTPNPEHTPGATSNQINQLSYTGLKGDLTQAGCTTCPSTTINGPVVFEAMYVPFAIDGLYE